jgi:myosin heavy subunit
MTEIGFSKEDQNKIWTLLLTILDLGNLEFDDTNHQVNETIPCVIINKEELPKIAKTLSLSP